MCRRTKTKVVAALIGFIVLVGGAFFLQAQDSCNCYEENQDACYAGEWKSTTFSGGTCASQYNGPSSCRGMVTVTCVDRRDGLPYPRDRQSVSDYCPDCDTNNGGIGGSVGDGCWNYWCMPNAY